MVIHYLRYVTGAVIGLVGIVALSVGQGLVNTSLWLMDRDDLVRLKREFTTDIKAQWASKQR